MYYLHCALNEIPSRDHIINYPLIYLLPIGVSEYARSMHFLNSIQSSDEFLCRQFLNWVHSKGVPEAPLLEPIWSVPFGADGMPNPFVPLSNK